MIKEVRLCLVLVLAALAIATGCKHKPAYSDIDVSKTSSTSNQNSEAKAASTPAAAEAGSPAAGASQPAGSPPAGQQLKSPAFMDKATGAIKDLPNYPRATRTGIQIGPSQGLNVMTLSLQTGDSMDVIAAFYQKVIADHRWTVVDKVIDPDQSQWILTKGTIDTARIEVKKDPTTSAKSILIVRGEKMDEPGK